MSHEEKKQVPEGFEPDVFDLVEPIRVFDDLYYVGNRAVGIHILKTSEGLVLIEATDQLNADEEILQPGLKKLGLENEKILILLLTHGHFDHYMGASGIQNRVGCPVGMSFLDTAYLSWADENMGPDVPRELPRITRILQDGETLTYGSHSIYVMAAPGHTPGCLNFCFDVHDHGEVHHVVMMGGYGVFGPGNYPEREYPYSTQWAVDQALTFASTCVKTWEYCKEHHCDVYMNPHPHLCKLIEHAEQNRQRGEGEPNTFVIGIEEVRKWILDRFNVCMDSVWKFTDIGVCTTPAQKD